MFNANFRARVLVLILCLVPLLGLSACTQQQADRFIEALILVIIASIIFMVIAAVVSLLWMIFSIVVIVFNFVRPNRFTMVAGYVLGGLDLLNILGGGGFMLVGMAEESASIAGGEIAIMILSMLLAAAFGGLKIASSVHAQRKIFGQKLDAIANGDSPASP